MSNKESSHKTEQQRVQVLNSWRTPENSRHIDAAIASGEAPRALALRLVKASIEEDEAVSEIVAEMNRLVDERSKPANRIQARSVATSDEAVDDFVTEFHRLAETKRYLI